MKGYLVALGAAIIAISLVVGALYLSASYNEYQSHLRFLGAEAGAPVTMYDVAKWEFAKILGSAIILGGLVSGSLLMGLGWMVKTAEEIRDALLGELSEHPAEPLPPSEVSKS